jgi:hypothetical protein
MRNLVICGLILLTLVLNCEAIAPVQLTGSSGQAILSQLQGSAQTANLSTNTSLWNWGGVPFGFTLNKSGIMSPFDDVNNGVWTPSI